MRVLRYGNIRSGEGNGNPLLYSILENPMDRGPWWAMVHEVARSWTQLSDLASVHGESWWEEWWREATLSAQEERRKEKVQEGKGRNELKLGLGIWVFFMKEGSWVSALFVSIHPLQAWARAGGVIFTSRAKVLRSLSPQDSHMICFLLWCLPSTEGSFGTLPVIAVSLLCVPYYVFISISCLLCSLKFCH